MHHRPRLACLLFVIVSVAACQPVVQASTAPGSQAPGSQAPAVVASPRPTADPCVPAMTGLGPYLQRLANDLAALRPLILAGTFDPAGTKAGVRAVSATLTSLLNTDQSLASCRLATNLSARIATLRARIKKPLAAALAASIIDGPAMRAGAVQILALLPEVLALSKASAAVATNLGLDMAIAQVPADATKPLGPLPPFPSAAPTPKPPAKGKVVAITAAYFGAGASIKTYRVTGASREAILRSINAKGPYSAWSGGHAEALTAAQPAYRFQFVTTTVRACTIVPSASPAVKITYTITLPAWKPPTGTAAATVTWWNGELTAVAQHERHHVDLFRAGQADLNAALAGSTCATAQAHLDAVWQAINRQQCEFDMAEYGTELGLSLKRCVEG